MVQLLSSLKTCFYFCLSFAVCRSPFIANRFSLNIQKMNVKSNEQEYKEYVTELPIII